MTSILKHGVILMAAVHKHESIKLTEDEAMTTVKWLNLADRYLMVDDCTLEIGIQVVGKGNKHGSLTKTKMKDIVGVAIQTCLEVIDWAVNAEESVEAIANYRKDLKKLDLLYCKCELGIN